MEFMFEDEADEVGSDVEAYCPKCKADTTHVVISKYEDEIRRVQCNPCGDVHAFRKPRGEAEEDVPEPIAAKKRALLKKLNWQEFFTKYAEKAEKNAKPYNFSEHYHENAIVVHPKFGKGFISEVVSDSKVEITFQDMRRVLVHNRKDLNGLPLAAEGDGISTAKAKKIAREVAAKAKGKAASPPKLVPPARPASKAAKPKAEKPKAAKASPKSPAKTKAAAKRPAAKPAKKAKARR